MVIRREDLYWLYRAIASRTTGLSRRLRLNGQVDRLETIARTLEERAGQLDRSVAGLAGFKWHAQAPAAAATDDADDAEAFVAALRRRWRLDDSTGA